MRREPMMAAGGWPSRSTTGRRVRWLQQQCPEPGCAGLAQERVSRQAEPSAARCRADTGRRVADRCGWIADGGESLDDDARSAPCSSPRPVTCREEPSAAAMRSADATSRVGKRSAKFPYCKYIWLNCCFCGSSRTIQDRVVSV